MLLSKLEIRNGYTMPWFYGIAYWKTTQCMAVCYPVPFNRIVRLVREAWLWLASPRANWREQAGHWKRKCERWEDWASSLGKSFEELVKERTAS